MENSSSETTSSDSRVTGGFEVDERVLCYEPDPSKAKVIYNAKILDFDGSEYLVHFRGWNSSWDRWVTKEYLLKDNPTNRVLQGSLSENAFKKDVRGARKKSPSRKRVLKNSLSSNGNSDTNARRKKRQPGECNLKITEPCKTFLKMDSTRVSKEGLFPIVPSVYPVAKVLETYVHHYAERQVALGEKSLGKQSLLPANQRESLVASELESILGSLEICKETMEGLRIILDYNLQNILLYEEEIQIHMPERKNASPSPVPPESESSRRPSTDPSSSSGRSTPTNSIGSLPSCSSINKTYMFKCVMDSLADWKLLPDSLYEESPLLPSLIYGPIYILRLLIKLPDILNKMKLPFERLKVIQKQINLLMDFLGSHPEYFSENMYSAPPAKSS